MFIHYVVVLPATTSSRTCCPPSCRCHYSRDQLNFCHITVCVSQIVRLSVWYGNIIILIIFFHLREVGCSKVGDKGEAVTTRCSPSPWIAAHTGCFQNVVLNFGVVRHSLSPDPAIVFQGISLQ
jgi:hypothetical protein